MNFIKISRRFIHKGIQGGSSVRFQCFNRMLQVYPLENLKNPYKPANFPNYCALIKKCAENNDIGHARELLGEMALVGMKPNTVAYNCFITGCVNCNNFSEASALFEEMKQQGHAIAPDSVSYNILIRMFSQRLEFEKAYELLDELSTVPKCKPNARTFLNILEPLRHYDIEKAFNLVLKMKEYNVELNSYINNSLLDTIAKSISPKKTFELFEFMKERKMDLDNTSYNIMIALCGRLNYYDKQVKYLLEMKHNGFYFDTATDGTLMNTLCKKDYESAFLLFKASISENTNNSDAFLVLVDYLGRSKRWKDLDEVMELIESNNIIPGIRIYNSIISNFGKARKINEIDNILEKISKQGIRLDIFTYGSLMNANLLAKRYSNVEKLYEELQEAGILPNNVIYCIILEALSRKHLFDKTQKVLQQMDSQGCVPSARLIRTLKFYKTLKEQSERIYPHLFLQKK